MSFTNLKTEFIKSRGKKSVPASLTLRFGDFEKMLNAFDVLSGEIDRYQTGVYAYKDSPARRGILKECGKSHEYISLSVNHYGSSGKERREAFEEIVALLKERDGADEEQLRNRRGWLTLDRKGFEIPIDDSELEDCLAICLKHGLFASLNMGPPWHYFSKINPIRLNERDSTVTINFRKKYDDQTQGRVIRDFLRLLEKRRLLPDSMALAGAEKRLSRRLTVQFNDFARGMTAMAEASPAVEGLELHSSFFIESTDSKRKTVTLRAAPEVADDFRETRFDGFIKPLTVSILENKPV